MRKFILATLVIIILLALFTGCRSAEVQSGIVTDKMYGTPSVMTIGIFEITYISRDSFCILVEDISGKSQWFVTDETTYSITRIGSEFIYDRNVYEPL